MISDNLAGFFCLDTELFQRMDPLSKLWAKYKNASNVKEIEALPGHFEN